MAQSKRKSGTGTGTGRSGTTRQEAPSSATPTMNERLRSRGRWVFAALAIIFAVSFILAGVGTGGPSLLDMLSQNNASNQPAETTDKPSVAEDALAATKAKPDDPQAWLGLAQAYVNDETYDKVGAAADKAAELAPKDVAVQTAIADIRLAQAAALLQAAQQQYLAAQGAGQIGGRPAVPQSVIPGQAQGATPFQTAQEAISSAQFQTASAAAAPLQTQADEAYKAAVTAQLIVTELQADDPAAWFRLGQIAAATNDSTQAIAAYQQFVKLAPEDPLVSKVKEEIDRLEKAANPAAGG